MKKPKGYMRGGEDAQRYGVRRQAGDGRKGRKAWFRFLRLTAKGKMKDGGMVPKTKGYFKGGRTMKNKMDTKGGKMGGKG